MPTLAARLLIVTATCTPFYLTSGIRTDSSDVIHARQECRHAAYESDASEFDFESLVFPAPDFNFLHSREFFLSDDPGCAQPLEGLTVEPIPADAAAKQALAEQRFVVKQARDMMKSVAHHDDAYLKEKMKMRKAMQDVQHAPAVELHMFPSSLENGTSAQWNVLLIPRCPEVFGRTLYLCQPPTHAKSSCVAKLRLKALPPRFRRLVWKWDPDLDTRRSVPHRFILVIEITLVLVVCSFVVKTLLSALKLHRVRGEPGTSMVESAKEELLSAQGPTTYLLSQHALLHDWPEGKAAEVLEAGTEVVVHEVRLLPVGWWESIRSLGCACNTVWGKVKEPRADVQEAWIVLFQDASCVVPPGQQKSVYTANSELLFSLPVMLRHMLLLCASYISVLWLAASQLRGFDDVSTFALAVSCFAIHFLVLLQRMHWYRKALEHDEALEQRKLLRLTEDFQGCSGFGLDSFNVLLVLILVGLAVELVELVQISSRASDVLPLGTLVLNLGIHAASRRQALRARLWWRRPQAKASELLATAGEQLPITSDKPRKLSRGRAVKALAMEYCTHAISSAGLVVLVAMCLDWLQMRGEITHMAWSRGHLVHPSSSTGFHNTLLLDMNADALTVDLDLGRHTRSINCIVQHTLLPPYHFPYEEIQGKHASRFELSVPRLPFYSRATFVAGGAHRNTLYVVHIIRLGEAMDISLNGAFPNRDPFLETRRLQYLEDHVEWYLPNISGQATLSLRIRPVSFAPLVPGGSDASLAEVPQVVDSCRCGNITAGFGNACDLQVEIPGHRLCVFVAEATRELGHLHHLSGVAGTSSELNAWLLNTTVSGKRVGLNIPEEPPVRYFQPLNNSRMQVVESTFKLTLAAEGLSRQGSQILVSITEDATDSEVTSIPVMFLFLAPPVVLTVDQDSQGDSCFLLPAFHATAEFRTEYMLCGGLSDVDQIATTVSDTRFQVVRQHESSRPGCGEYMDHRLELRVVRKPETNCSGWCKSYQARTEDYDLAVVKSAGHCLRQAMELDDSESMERIIKQQGAALPCVAELGLLGEAVSRNQSAVVKMMLGDKVSWNQTSGGGTPLQIAGMNGNIAMLRLLLEANADLNDQSHGPTALAYASEQCQVPAVRFLLDNGARADVGPRTEDTSEEECKHNPLLYLLMDRAAHCGIEAKQETAKLLLDKNVTKGIPAGCTGRVVQRIMRETFDLTDLELMVQSGADVEEAMSLMASFTYKIGDAARKAFICSAVPLLVDRNASMEDLLEKVAVDCDVELFSELFRPGGKNHGDVDYIRDEARGADCKNDAAKTAILELIDKDLQRN